MRYIAMQDMTAISFSIIGNLCRCRVLFKAADLMHMTEVETEEAKSRKVLTEL